MYRHLDIESSMNYILGIRLGMPPINDALAFRVKCGRCPIALDWGKGRSIFDDSAITPATSRGFANGFFLGHVWDVLLWSRNSRGSVSYRQVARDGGVKGLSRGKPLV